MKAVECKKCDRQILKSNGRYNESVKNNWNFFCCIACRYGYQEKATEIPCAQCRKVVRKTPAQVRQTKENTFCSKSCAALYNNSHKTYGSRRSKLEAFIEQRLHDELPELNFECNASHAIGTELDFYFPQLGMAIEFNGIFHYQPIYGREKLTRIQNRDKEKVERCLQTGIKLFVIDVSQEIHTTQHVKEKYWARVKELVTSKQKRAGHTNEQVP